MNISKANYPSLAKRLYSVWYRHLRVYWRNIISNAFPPFLEPLIFLAGIGLGLGSYISTMGGMPYIVFLATGLPMTAAMWSASFECTFGTFIRMEFDHIYDGMLAASINAKDLVLGELLWVGTKGLFFSMAVLIVVSCFKLVPFPTCLLACSAGFLTGFMFGALSMTITSFVKTINHFNFFFTGLLSPMFFFCGVVFPIEQLPKFLLPVAEAMPLTHTVRLTRAICVMKWESVLAWDLVYCILFMIIFGTIAVVRMRKRLID
ncbi:MAG: ABC transporter permease [Fibrobacteres bacterium]|nr:ABC transporter permease [Fibrobacterota bacterium]